MEQSTLKQTGLADAEHTRRRIALTFDDAPNSDDSCLTDELRTTRLVQSLRSVDVHQVVFFCVTNKLDPAGLERLHKYAQAGHVLANHTHDHYSLETIDADAFLDNVRRADAILNRLPNFQPYFRFPFLNEGDTSEKRSEVRAGLNALGYLDAYITVPTLDWYMQEMFYRTSQRHEHIDLQALGDAYVQMVVEGVSFYDDLATKLLGRSPQHVLLLHENDLAALFIGDLVERLRATGWEIVPPDCAYSDALSDLQPRTLDAGHGRIAALARDRGYSAPVVSPWETKANIDCEFARRGVW
jgi:peptidoglycan/xylan/chitin deacetylase (PgdA/CDA1 family)